MRVAEQIPGPDAAEGDWADKTRRVLTRDLLMRAARAQPGESQALQFRALHLNLPLVGEVADGLGLPDPARPSIEHAALEGLHLAMRVFDPFGVDDFADFAVPFVEQRVVSRLPTARPATPSLTPTLAPGAARPRARRPRRPVRRQAALRLVVRRMADVLVGRA